MLCFGRRRRCMHGRLTKSFILPTSTTLPSVSTHVSSWRRPVTSRGWVASGARPRLADEEQRSESWFSPQRTVRCPAVDWNEPYMPRRCPAFRRRAQMSPSPNNPIAPHGDGFPPPPGTRQPQLESASVLPPVPPVPSQTPLWQTPLEHGVPAGNSGSSQAPVSGTQLPTS